MSVPDLPPSHATRQSPMSVAERVGQAVLFEAIALLLSFGLVQIFGHQPPTGGNDWQVWVMLLGISLLAMVWTFVYNVLFDKVFTQDKLSRPFWLRALHIIGFEGGLLCFTLPLVMWVLSIGVWQALMLDIAMSLTVLVYGFGFYWLYDVLRARVLAAKR